MPLYLTSFLLPASPGVPYVLEDTHLRGGYKVVATLTARDALAPASRKAGMRVYVQENATMYTLEVGALTTWVVVGKRKASEYIGASLAAGASQTFTFATGKAAMLLSLVVNAPGLKVEAFATAARDDTNPFTFISYAGHLSDDGSSKLDNDELEYNRRYAFLCNLEDPNVATTYWRVTNTTGAAITPQINIVSLEMER